MIANMIHSFWVLCKDGTEDVGVLHLNKLDGTCDCSCSVCTTPKDEHGEIQCRCPDCNVEACGTFHVKA